MQFARRAFYAMLLVTVAALAACATTPDQQFAREQQVRRASTTLEDFQRNPDMRAFRNHIKTAKAVIIAPGLTRAALVVGGSGGEAIVLARDSAGGAWSEPAFYSIREGSVGAQLGVDVFEVVMLVMSDKALDALLSQKFLLGGDASVAAGRVGVGESSSVAADVVSFARSKGAYAGVSMEGAVVTPDAAANAAYYGRPAAAVDVLVRHNVHNAESASLQQAISAAAR